MNFSKPVSLLFFITSFWSSALSTEEPPHPPVKPAVESLIAGLGSERWEVRENSQNTLLDMGSAAIPALKKALLSKDPEVVQRARHLLNRIDPMIVHFRITKVRLGDPPGMEEVWEVEARDGEEVQIPPVTAPGKPQTADSLNSYVIQHRPIAAGRLDMDVKKARGGSASLAAPAGKPCEIQGAVSILERGEEAFYLQIGLHMERRRLPFLTLLEYRRGRRSGWVDGEEAELQAALPPRAGRSLEALRSQLQVQARHPNLEARKAALEILGWLQDQEDQASLEILRQACRDNACRDLALLALGRWRDEAALKKLRELLAAENFPEEAQGPPSGQENAVQGFKRKPLALDAALLLSRLGRSGGGGVETADPAFNFLVEKLSAADPNLSHSVLAEVADRLSAGGPPPASLALLLEKLATEDTLNSLPWNDLETQFFFSRVLERLDEKSPQHQKFAQKLLASAVKVFSGNDTLGSSAGRAFLNIWEGVLRRMPAAALQSEVLEFFFEDLRDQGQLAKVCLLMNQANQSQPLPAELFEALVEAFNRQRKEPGRAVPAINLLLVITQNLALSENQLKTAVKLLLEVAKSAQQHHQRELANEISRLTGIEIIQDKRGSAKILAVWNPEVFKKKIPEIESWLADSDAIRLAHQKLASLSPGESPAPQEAMEIEYLEFDLLRRAENSPAHGNSDAAGPPAASNPTASNPAGTLLDLLSKSAKEGAVLDARFYKLTTGANHFIRDRWGNLLRLRVDVQPPVLPAQSPRKGDSAGIDSPQFKLANGLLVPSAIPALINPGDRILRAEWYEITDNQLGAFLVPAPSRQSFFTLVLIRPAGGTSGPGQLSPISPAPQDPELSQPQVLWKRFLDSFYASISSLSDDDSIRRALQITRDLNLREAAQPLQRLFQKNPKIEIAQRLLELGEASAVPYLRQELAKASFPRQIQIAQMLTEAGDREGLRMLLDLLQKKNSENYYYMAVKSLDNFLLKRNPTPEEHRQILDLVVKNLHRSNVQAAGFNILLREAGTDFGYSQIWTMAQTQERPKAQADAVERARQWWAERKKVTSGK
ncbi:MAG: HEAT repeat domain-containing protein [Planctomycetes bacterium]|nr:HEAT repeat domain-containing protein [Planctomycetota bacterium]